MKIAIMQPYFLPYIGYWQLMNLVDTYVVFDDVNYINRGWINRNRILVNGMPHFINLPIVKASQNKLIKDLCVNTDSMWREKNMRMIELAYGRTIYCRNVLPMIQRIMYCQEEDLVGFLTYAMKEICEYLDIETKRILSSDMKKDNSLKGQYRVLDICKKLSADEYINAIGGRELYNEDLFLENRIKLNFLQTNQIQYEQFKNSFCANLSIIDVIMFNSQKECKEILKQYTLV